MHFAQSGIETIKIMLEHVCLVNCEEAIRELLCLIHNELCDVLKYFLVKIPMAVIADE